MRILIAGVTYPPEKNGQAIFTGNLAEGLARRGHQVSMLSQSERGFPYQRTANGVQIYAAAALPLNFWHAKARYSLFPRRAVERVMDRFQPDLIHVQDHYTLCNSVISAARRRGLPVMGTNHFMPQNLAPYLSWLFFSPWVFEQIMWKWVSSVFNRLTGATAPSIKAASILRRRGVTIPVQPVSCGIALDRFFPDSRVQRTIWRRRFGLDEDKALFLFVGRVDKEKRLDVLVRALNRLRRSDAQLAIAGTGEALGSLKGLVRRYNLESVVRFLGPVSDAELPALLNCADVFAMPSEAELLSIATLEAMACGLPVLAADAQALPELVSYGVNGYLFCPGDEDDAARHMALLMEQRARWLSMGRASLAVAQHHTLEKTLDRYEELYAGMIAARRPHAVVARRSQAGGRRPRRRPLKRSSTLDEFSPIP